METRSQVVFLSLGSNIEPRQDYLHRAIRMLGKHIDVVRVSSTYETEPWGYSDQDRFLNIALEGRTHLAPLDLLARIKSIESDLGRQPTFRYGPRVIDIDLLLYDDVILESQELIIPHPCLAERAFVLVPLAEIAPGLRMPGSNLLVSDLLARCGSLQDVKKFSTANRFIWGSRTYVMGILNITPDSFSGDGLLTHPDTIQTAVDQALLFESQGADILDIGGESSRPGSTPLTAAEEMDRILPVIRAIRARTDIPISIDTYKSEVARQALAAGADWINDIWAFQADPDLAGIVAETGCPIVLMHNRSKSGEVILHRKLGGMYRGAEYNDFMRDVIADLQVSMDIGFKAGVKPDQIILDPGIGFGKTVAQNLELINHLERIRALGYPVLLGPSRKSFIGQVLGLPADERLEGTLSAVSIGIARGADIMRVHDVLAGVRTARMTDALVRNT